jgi:hypothetical protein
MAPSRSNVPAIDSTELRELTEKLITACHILDHEGVTDGYGHVSVRVPGADAFITISNVSPGCVTTDRLIMQDFDGNHLGGAKTPPNEWPIHACILRARPEDRQRRAYSLQVEHDLQRAADQAQAHSPLREISLRQRAARV